MGLIDNGVDTSIAGHRSRGIVFRTTLCLLLFGLLLCLGSSAAGQGRFPGAPNEPSVNLRVYPLDTWSPRVGFGLGVGFVVHHLGRSNAQGVVTFAPAQHEQVTTLSWASANPRSARQYVLLSARGLHTNRDWFYGLGPYSDQDDRQSLSRSAVQVRVRGGQTFFHQRLVIQPHLGFSLHRTDRVPQPLDPTLGPRSRAHLRQLASEKVGPLSPQHSGLEVGISLIYDRRTRKSGGTRGYLLQGRWTRYFDLTSSFVQFDQFGVGIHGHLPLTKRHRIASRLQLKVTASQGRTVVPYYLLPTLGPTHVPGWGRNRFVAQDRLLGSILYQFPIMRLRDLLTLRGHFGVHAANVYQDLLSEITLDMSFQESLPTTEENVPLRPSASVGLHLGLPFRQSPSFDFALGLSPEGLTAAQFTFSQNLRAIRPIHHRDVRDH